MKNEDVLPPGRHAHDPWKPEIDSVGFALAGAQTHLIWIDEHLASFKALRSNAPTMPPANWATWKIPSSGH
jgi:hypothetical protein